MFSADPFQIVHQSCGCYCAKVQTFAFYAFSSESTHLISLVDLTHLFRGPQNINLGQILSVRGFGFGRIVNATLVQRVFLRFFMDFPE